MIRILQVVSTMDFGGAETFIMNVYRNIDRTKIQFDFLCHNRVESAYREEILQLGGRMYSVPGIRYVGPQRYQKNLYEFFVSHPEYKVVHSHVGRRSGLILRQARKAGVPVRISHAHSKCGWSLTENLQLLVWKSFFPHNVTKALACAVEAGNSLYIGKLKNRFEFIPNAIDTQKMCYSAEGRERIYKELDISCDVVFGHVGRFSAEKNHRFIIEIFKKIIEKKTNAVLLLIGEGELKTEMQRYAKELGVAAKVHFLGSRRDIPDCLSAMDMFLFPSFIEGLSVACVEAQASGLPILTSTNVSNEIAITDLVRQEPLSKSADEWAGITLEMLEQAKGRNRTSYAEKVKKAGFDIQEVTEKMRNMYQEAYFTNL